MHLHPNIQAELERLIKHVDWSKISASSTSFKRAKERLILTNFFLNGQASVSLDRDQLLNMDLSMHHLTTALDAKNKSKDEEKSAWQQVWHAAWSFVSGDGGEDKEILKKAKALVVQCVDDAAFICEIDDFATRDPSLHGLVGNVRTAANEYFRKIFKKQSKLLVERSVAIQEEDCKRQAEAERKSHRDELRRANCNAFYAEVEKQGNDKWYVLDRP